MHYFKIDQARDNDEPLTSVAPILRSLMKLDSLSRERLKCKFDLCFTMAKEGIPFVKYTSLYELENRHGVDIGTSYSNDISCKNFTHCVAELQRSSFINFLKREVSFFSFLMDGTTDVARAEDEAIVLLYCKQDDLLKEIQSCARFLSVNTANKADADDLLKCLGEALSILGIVNLSDQSNILASMPIL